MGGRNTRLGLRKSVKADTKLFNEMNKRKEAENRIKQLEAEVKKLKRTVKRQQKKINELSSNQLAENIKSKKTVPNIPTPRSLSDSKKEESPRTNTPRGIFRSVKCRLIPSIDNSSPPYEISNSDLSESDLSDFRNNSGSEDSLLFDEMETTQRGTSTDTNSFSPAFRFEDYLNGETLEESPGTRKKKSKRATRMKRRRVVSMSVNLGRPASSPKDFSIPKVDIIKNPSDYEEIESKYIATRDIHGKPRRNARKTQSLKHNTVTRQFSTSEPRTMTKHNFPEPSSRETSRIVHKKKKY